MKAYHFLSAKYALEALDKQRLKVSLLDDLNDPFELYAAELSNKSHRAAFTRWKRKMAKDFGVICFSKNWNNPLLWSHYADKHKGIALELEIPSDVVHEVNYSTERLFLDIESKLKTGALGEADIYLLLTTKFKQWEYEDEVRVFVRLSECEVHNGLYFQRLGSELPLVGLILGPRCQMSTKEIKAKIPSGMTVTLTNSRLAFKRFAVVTNKAVTSRQ